MDKGVVIIIGITVVILGSIIGITMNNPQQKLTNSFTGEDNDTISEQGVHYHPELSIVINGQKQEIPANIGVGAQYASNKFYDPMMKMTDIHTHDPGGVLHWEVMDGPVKKGHVKLGSFFNVWGKTFTKDQIFEAKNADSG
ncbi:MAG TPA: hypothetical protein VGE59_00885, partial [Patescibacteria group bacterium]